jgi:hypothetical protein
MSNPDQNEQPKGIMVVVELRDGLLNHFSVAEWNAFMADLMSRDLIPAVWASGKRPPPVTVDLNFKGLQRAHYRLDGIDLSLCYLDHANFTGASLKNARLGAGKQVSYRGARLQGADFRGIEISGNDFTDSQGTDPAMFQGAYYAPDNPPKGLPPEVLAVCERDEATAVRPTSGQSVPTESPLRACVTIQRIPME